MKCYTCNQTIHRPQSQLKAEKNFCNQQCYSKFKTTLVGEKSRRWSGGNIKFKCSVCAKDCERKRFGKNTENRYKYCSIECSTKDRSEVLVGEKHWNWKGGTSTRYKRKFHQKPDKCEVCKANGSDFKKGLCFDHNHKTGKFRGWLCSNCNTALGLVKENPKILLALIKYLNEKSSLIDSNAEMPTRRKAKATVRD